MRSTSTWASLVARGEGGWGVVGGGRVHEYVRAYVHACSTVHDPAHFHWHHHHTAAAAMTPPHTPWFLTSPKTSHSSCNFLPSSASLLSSSPKPATWYRLLTPVVVRGGRCMQKHSAKRGDNCALAILKQRRWQYARCCRTSLGDLPVLAATVLFSACEMPSFTEKVRYRVLFCFDNAETCGCQ